jgi:hypothetical protein
MPLSKENLLYGVIGFLVIAFIILFYSKSKNCKNSPQNCPTCVCPICPGSCPSCPTCPNCLTCKFNPSLIKSVKTNRYLMENGQFVIKESDATRFWVQYTDATHGFIYPLTEGLILQFTKNTNSNVGVLYPYLGSGVEQTSGYALDNSISMTIPEALSNPDYQVTFEEI